MKVNKLIESFFVFGMILTIAGSFGAASVCGQTASEKNGVNDSAKILGNSNSVKLGIYSKSTFIDGIKQTSRFTDINNRTYAKS